MVTRVVIAWSEAADGRVDYFVNTQPVGSDRDGFDAVLAFVRDNPQAEVMLEGWRSALGGQDLDATTPFADRFPEMREALGARSLTWSLM